MENEGERERERGRERERERERERAQGLLSVVNRLLKVLVQVQFGFASASIIESRSFGATNITS